MSNFSSNLKLLRKRKGWSQQGVSDVLGVTRSSWSSYETGASEPSLSLLQKIGALYGVSLDKLIVEDLGSWSEQKLSELDRGMDPDFHGHRLRVLATAVDVSNREQIEAVPQKAKAGYAAGYADLEFIKELPLLSIPFLDAHRKHRCFQLSGDSMPPFQDGEYVVGEYVSDWFQVKDGTPCLVVTKADGVVFKRVYNRLKTHRSLLLESTNSSYEPYFVEGEEVLEVWKFTCAIVLEFPENDLSSGDQLSGRVAALGREIAEIKYVMKKGN